MLNFRATSLRFRLMLLVALAILPIFVLMFRHTMEERDRELRNIKEQAVRQAEVSAASVSQILEGTQQILLALAYTEPVRAMNGTAASPLFADLLRQSKPYTNLGLSQPNGLIIGSALPLNGAVFISNKPWLDRLKTTRGFAMSDLQKGSITGKLCINFGYPLPSRADAPPPGIVYASLDLRAIQECISRHHLPPSGAILVVDRKGTYVARTPGPEKWVGTKSSSWAALQAKGGSMEGFVEAIGVDGANRIYHYAPVEGSDNGLFVAVGVSKAAVLAESWAGFRSNLAWLGVWTVVSLVGAWFFCSFSVLKHVQQLTEASRRLARGDWYASARIAGGALELRELSQTFDAMAETLRQHNEELERQVRARTAELRSVNRDLHTEIAERKRTEIALHEKEAHLSEAQRIARLGSWRRDLLTGELFWSKETCRIFGWPDDKPITFERFMEFVHPDDVEALHAQQIQAMQGCQGIETEHRIIRPDGQIRYLHERGHFRRDALGRVTHLEGIAHDITERKIIESEREGIIAKLQEALAEVKTLNGLLPICSGCKKIRDDTGYWRQIESYISAHSGAQFSHGFCPDCARHYFPELVDEVDESL